MAAVYLTRRKGKLALDVLKDGRYDLGLEIATAVNVGTAYLPFMRAEAFLATKQPAPAAAQFGEILAHRGIVLNTSLVPVSRLGLARAYALQGDAAKARAAYQDFLTLWKDADPDIPILQQAKAEYAKLK